MQIFIIFITLLVIEQIFALCRFTQKGTTSDVMPTEIIPPGPAFDAPSNIAAVCPDYIDKQVCCNEDQITAIGNNQIPIDNNFGELAGGCEVCGINIKRLYCTFTCDSNQDQFGK